MLSVSLYNQQVVQTFGGLDYGELSDVFKLFFFFFAYAPVHMVHIELILLGTTSLALLPEF